MQEDKKYTDADRYGIDLLSDLVVYYKYARINHEAQRKETFEEICDRLSDMHIKKYPKFKDKIVDVFENFVKTKKVFPSMRSLQFGGKAIESNHCRMYNCSYLSIKEIQDFGDIMFLLMSGVGVGYGVFERNLSSFKFCKNMADKKEESLSIDDSAEGWSNAIVALLKSYLLPDAPVYSFKYTKIRPAGTPLITSGGLAPGKEPLQRAIINIRRLLENRRETQTHLYTVDLHDIVCFLADAVISGGNRRSALISLFSPDDTRMFEAKDYDNYNFVGKGNNLQRARANNSVVLDRSRHGNDIRGYIGTVLDKAIANGFGEPGVFLSPTEDGEWGTNPCGEIGLNSHQFCNLTTINVEVCRTQQEFLESCDAATFLGTLQAGYTDFPYIAKKWQEVTEKEALLGVSMTGIATQFINNPDINLTEAAEYCVAANRRYAELIGINPAYRITTVKPEGSSSKVIGTSSGIHPWHNEHYIQRITFSRLDPAFKYLERKFKNRTIPDLFKPILQDDPTNPESVYFAIPIKAPKGCLTRNEPVDDMLFRISRVFKEWILPGTVNPNRKFDRTHNVSCTISFKPNEIDTLKKWLFNNYHEYNAFTIAPATDPEQEKKFPVLMWEDITEETYYKTVAMYQKYGIDLTEIFEVLDTVNHASESLACTAGGCDIL